MTRISYVHDFALEIDLYLYRYCFPEQEVDIFHD